MKNQLKVVACECGKEILVVPDLRKMKRVIDTHAKTHGRSKSGKQEAENERRRIETQLTNKVIMQILEVAPAELTNVCQLLQSSHRLPSFLFSAIEMAE